MIPVGHHMSNDLPELPLDVRKRRASHRGRGRGLRGGRLRLVVYVADLSVGIQWGAGEVEGVGGTV